MVKYTPDAATKTRINSHLISALVLSQGPGFKLKLDPDIVVVKIGFRIEGVVGRDEEAAQWQHGFAEGLLGEAAHEDPHSSIPQDLRAAYDKGYEAGRLAANDPTKAPEFIELDTPVGNLPLSQVASEAPDFLDTEWQAGLKPGDFEAWAKSQRRSADPSVLGMSVDELAKVLGMPSSNVIIEGSSKVLKS